MKGKVSSMSNKHLSVWGVGPIYVSTISITTFILVVLNLSGKLPTYDFSIPLLPIILGSLLIIIGIVLWITAVVLCKLTNKIKENILVTDGVFAYVRNPIYSAFMLICTGIIVLLNNLFLLFFPVLYWLFLTILLIHTEEKWLRKVYKEEYEKYCRTVNRCIPFYKRRAK